LQGEIINKKQREYSSDESFMELTPSPVVAKSPPGLNSNTTDETHKSEQQTINIQSHVSAQNIPVEIPHAQIIGAENPVNHDQSVIHGD
ncbi:MAG: hypothetical protein AB2693_08570, partial [Candidatus Thiodiazotropha sp.]